MKRMLSGGIIVRNKMFDKRLFDLYIVDAEIMKTSDGTGDFSLCN